MKKIMTNLTFLIMCMFASVSFADKAFYDSETGIAVIPEISIDGQDQSIMLQKNDDSSFDVIELNQNQETSMSLAKRSEKTKHCSTLWPQETRDEAKSEFQTHCGRAWDDQVALDKCVSRAQGWYCSGTVITTTGEDAFDAIAEHVGIKAVHPTGVCTTNFGFRGYSSARNWFSVVCGTYDDQKGICEFVDGINRFNSNEIGGYRCYGG